MVIWHFEQTLDNSHLYSTLNFLPTLSVVEIISVVDAGRFLLCWTEPSWWTCMPMVSIDVLCSLKASRVVFTSHNSSTWKEYCKDKAISNIICKCFKEQNRMAIIIIFRCPLKKNINWMALSILIHIWL